MVVVLAENSAASVGNATLVIVMSSRSMNSPTTNMTATRYLFSKRLVAPRPPALTGKT
jgi:hypothetical protein